MDVSRVLKNRYNKPLHYLCMASKLTAATFMQAWNPPGHTISLWRMEVCMLCTIPVAASIRPRCLQCAMHVFSSMIIARPVWIIDPLMASMTRKDHGTSQGRKEPSVSIAESLGCMICKELSSKNVSQVLHLEQKPTKDYHITVPAS